MKKIPIRCAKVKSLRLAKIFTCLTFLMIGLSSVAQGEIPTSINYQGRLLDDQGSPVNATVPVSVTVWTAEMGGTQVFTQNVGSVTVDNGLYDFSWGDAGLTTALTNEQTWLQVQVGNEILSPRERLLSVPYALQAGSIIGGNPGRSGSSSVRIRTYQEIDGTGSPKVMAKANNVGFLSHVDNYVADSLLGITRDSNAPLSSVLPSYLSGTAVATSFGVSVGLPPGTNRAIVVIAIVTGSNRTITGIDLDGAPLVQAATAGSSVNRIAVYVGAIGDSMASSSGTIGISGSFSSKYVAAAIYDNVDQTDVYGFAKAVSGQNPALNINVRDGYGLQVFGGFIFSGSVITTPASAVRRHSNGGLRPFIYDAKAISGEPWETTSTSISAAAGLVSLLPANPAGGEIEVITLGDVDGFIGLTPGAPYYFDDDGELTLSPLTGDVNNTFVGFAKDSTTLTLSKPSDTWESISATSTRLHVSSGQKLVIWWKGTDQSGGGTYSLRVNGETIDTINDGGESWPQAASMFSTYVPGEGFHTIDVSGFSGSHSRFLILKTYN